MVIQFKVIRLDIVPLVVLEVKQLPPPPPQSLLFCNRTKVSYLIMSCLLSEYVVVYMYAATIHNNVNLKFPKNALLVLPKSNE